MALFPNNISRLQKVIAANVRWRRLSMGLSQEAFADLCGYHRTYIGLIERSERNITVSTLETLASTMGFSLFDDVRSQGVNEADAASGMPGDIMCHKDGDLCLVVEVKDQTLTLADARSSARKAKESGSGLSNLLFTVPGIRDQDMKKIQDLSHRNWASGLNIYTMSIQGLVYHAFALLEEDWRARFMRAICNELDDRQDQSARKAWHDLLLKQDQESPA